MYKCINWAEDVADMVKLAAEGQTKTMNALYRVGTVPPYPSPAHTSTVHSVHTAAAAGVEAAQPCLKH